MFCLTRQVERHIPVALLHPPTESRLSRELQSHLHARALLQLAMAAERRHAPAEQRKMAEQGVEMLKQARQEQLVCLLSSALMS